MAEAREGQGAWAQRSWEPGEGGGTNNLCRRGSRSREGLLATYTALQSKRTRMFGNSQLDVILWNSNTKGRRGTH